MTKSKINLLGSLFVAGALAAAGCGGGSSGGTGGASGSGAGGSGTGGAGGKGTGGSSAGGSGAGGSGTGGSGAGGSTDAGSDSGTGGAATDAATDSSTDATDAAAEAGPMSHLIPIGTFDTDLSGFSLLFVTTNLQPEGGAQPTAEFDGTIGKPDPGSAKITIPFVPITPTMDEHVEFGKNFTPTDLTGRIVTARVMVDAVDGSSPGFQAFFVLKSGTATNANAFVYANGAFTNLSPGNWVTVIMLADSPGFAATGFDPTRIEQIAVGIQAADPTNAGLTTAAFHIDSVGYQ